MKLTFFYLPVADLKEALALYRDTSAGQRPGGRATRPPACGSPAPTSS